MSDEQEPDIWEKLDRIEKDVASLMLRVSKLENRAPSSVPQPMPKGKGTPAPTNMSELLVNQIRNGDQNITLNTRITTISPITTGLKKGTSEEWRKMTVRVGDYTGQLDLVLWGEQIDEYDTLMQGNYITITGAYTKEYQNKIQLLLGKTGKILLAKEEHIP